MWLPIATTVAATQEPIALDDAKDFLRVDDTSQDNLIAGLIASARAHVESYTATRLLTQTVLMRASSFADAGRLPLGPVQSVPSVQYIDASGALQTLDSSAYEAFGAGLLFGLRPAFTSRWPATRPIADAVLVTAVVGYGAAEDVPQDIRHAMLLLIGDFCASREDTILERGVTPATLPNGVDALLCNHRIYA